MGHPKAGGRIKGTPNKKTQALIDICEEKGINPFEALLELTQHDDVAVKLQALKEICSYLYPKRKAIETTPEVVVNNNHMTVTNEQLDQLVKRAREM